jgi:hypothetical protein
MNVNGFNVVPARGGYAVVRADGIPIAMCRTRPGAVEIAERFVPVGPDGRPLERYKPAPWWRRLFNPDAAGRWERVE